MDIKNDYVYYNGKKLRYGYTTGSSATAATKVALSVLLGIEDETLKKVELTVPAGQTIEIHVERIEKLEDGSVLAVVLKDGGDDPDVTHGLEIISKVKFRDDNKINVFGGKGVGKVTKIGLPVEIGKSAINPTPMSMIKGVIDELLPKGKGIDVEISVPRGEEVSRKTLNSKLGIIGGISILGTMGIVRPMSEESWKSSLAIELKQALVEFGENEALFLFGNRGKSYLEENFPNRAKQGVVISNFVGYMFDRACEYNVKKVYFIGEIGKFVKVAGGIFHTHSRVSDAKMEIFAANALLVNEKIENVYKILGANTTEEATSYVTKKEVYNLLSEKSKQKCQEYCRRNGREDLEVECLIISAERKILGHSKHFFDKF